MQENETELAAKAILKKFEIGGLLSLNAKKEVDALDASNLSDETLLKLVNNNLFATNYYSDNEFQFNAVLVNRILKLLITMFIFFIKKH